MATNSNLRMALEKASVGHDGELERFKEKLARLQEEAGKAGLKVTGSVSRVAGTKEPKPKK